MNISAKDYLLYQWQEIKPLINDIDQVERIILKRIDTRKYVRFVNWASALYENLRVLTKKAAICKKEQKEENVATFTRYLDEREIWFPWAGNEPGWPTRFCGYKECTVLDWRSLTDSAEMFAKLIVSEDISELDHGEETTIVDLKIKQYNQTAIYYPGW